MEVAVVGRRRRWRRRQRQFIKVSVVSAVLAMVSGVGCNFVGFLNGSNCGVINCWVVSAAHFCTALGDSLVWRSQPGIFSSSLVVAALHVCAIVCAADAVAAKGSRSIVGDGDSEGISNGSSKGGSGVSKVAVFLALVTVAVICVAGVSVVRLRQLCEFASSDWWYLCFGCRVAVAAVETVTV